MVSYDDDFSQTLADDPDYLEAEELSREEDDE